MKGEGRKIGGEGGRARDKERSRGGRNVTKQWQDFHFIDIFASRLTNETRIVGSYYTSLCKYIRVEERETEEG